MKILAIECSGLVASATIVEDSRVIAEVNINNRRTHSTTLLPMIDSIIKYSGIELSELDAVAVSKGPGSFTGLRIGSASAKGIALALDIPIVEISTLEAMAYRLYGSEDLICPLIDARRNQVYTGVYRFEGEALKNVYGDRACDVKEIISWLNERGESAILSGDGFTAYKDELTRLLTVPYKTALAFQNRQGAAALGILAIEYAKSGRIISADMHRPEYLRASQAERERAEKLHAADS